MNARVHTHIHTQKQDKRGKITLITAKFHQWSESLLSTMVGPGFDLTFSPHVRYGMHGVGVGRIAGKVL